MTKPSSTTSITPVDSTSESLPQLRPSPSNFMSPEAERLLAFEDIVSLVNLYDATGWTLEREIMLLIDMIQNTESDVTKLRALQQLQARRTEVLKKSGLLVTATQTRRSPDGSQTTLSSNLVAAALGNSNENSKRSKSDGRRKYTKQKFTDEERQARRVRANARKRDTESGQFVGIRPDSDTAERDANRDEPVADSPKPETVESGEQGGTSVLHKPPTSNRVAGGIARTGAIARDSEIG